MKKQTWFEYPNFIPFPRKGMKIMYPKDGHIYEVFLRGYYPYDHWDNDGLMGVYEGIKDEYVTIEWIEEGIKITFLEEEEKSKKDPIYYKWDRVYPIPQ